MTATVTRPRGARIDWENIERLYFQGHAPASIAKQTGVNSAVIRVGLTRRNANKRKLEMIEKGGKHEIEALGRSTRAKLAMIAEKTVDALQEPPKSLENLAIHAEIAQKTAKTAALVHGWGEGSSVNVLISGVLGAGADDPGSEPAIDVESEQSDG